MPTLEIEKDELVLAGLGEKFIEFPTLCMTATEFKELLMTYFPKLKHCGGYHLCKATPKGILEPLSKLSYSSPEILKQRCGANRTYIVPLQHNLDLSLSKQQNISESVSFFFFIY